MVRPSITARISLEEKARFTELAAAAGLSESALASQAIRTVLDPHGSSTAACAAPVTREAATDRITIRLRPGDRDAIARRASERGMKDSTYIAALVRAHVAANPPLATRELRALKRGVVALTTAGCLLVKIWRTTDDNNVTLLDRLERMHDVVRRLERCMFEFAKASLISWESHNG